MIIVGDSHVEALGPALQERIGADVQYIARRGWSSSDYAKASDWRPYLVGHDTVVYPLGTNDAAKGLSALMQDAAWRTLVPEAFRAGAKVVIVVGPPTIKDPTLAAKAAAVAAFQASTVPKLGAVWIDARPLSPGPWAADRTHQTIPGYGRWADNLAPLLVRPPDSSTSNGKLLLAGLGVVGALALAVGLTLRASRN